jgi:threonine synthase
LADSPFVIYRQQLDVYRHALARGLGDRAYVELVTAADQRLAAVDGRGFVVTPLVELSLPGYRDRGRVMAKVETGNVAGSHKARHLFGLLLRFLIDEAAAPASGAGRPDLAIASCGNAAVGAAVVASSGGRRLLVFVPAGADPAVVARLEELGARIEVCHRRPGQPGDPCVERLQAALADGAQPFTVQGTLCPAVIDGGRTIGLELGDQLERAALTASDLYVQVGGGALATAVMDGLQRRRPAGSLPRLHPVQARSAHPYVAGWHRIAGRLLAGLGLADPLDDRRRAALLAAHAGQLQLPADLERWAGLMTPWPSEPRSVATGILDDLTYDWRGVMSHQIATGGWPVTVEESTLLLAADLVRAAISPPPDETGAAGLAGLLQDGVPGPPGPPGPPGAGDTCSVVLLTGADRARRSHGPAPALSPAPGGPTRSRSATRPPPGSSSLRARPRPGGTSRSPGSTGRRPG